MEQNLDEGLDDSEKFERDRLKIREDLITKAPDDIKKQQRLLHAPTLNHMQNKRLNPIVHSQIKTIFEQASVIENLGKRI